METYLINESIEKERIQLDFHQSLVHYRFSIILLLVSIFSITNGLQNVSTIDFDLNNFQTKISFFFVIVCLISFFYQRNRLKLISVETNEDGNFLIERIKNYLPKIEVIIPNDKTIKYKEALIFALLGVLKLRNEINVLASVTGAKQNHSSGEVF